MKRFVKRWLLGADSIPQWVAVAIRPPQQQASIWLRGIQAARTFALDVTRNATVTALRPLTFGLCLANHVSQNQLGETSPVLVIRDGRLDGRILGQVKLRYTRSLDASAGRIDLFEVAKSRNYCLPWLRLQLHYLNEWRVGRMAKRNKGSQQGYNFSMPPRDLHSLFVFYTCPRPVVFVSVSHEGQSNLFPMDLIGPTDSPYFLMALRRTSPAVQLMQRSRRLALADVPAGYRDIAYDLGQHHKNTSINVEALPFETTLSPTWSLPVAKAALGIREVEVETTESIGSHELFVTRIVHEAHWHDGPQLFHVPGLYQHYLARQQCALELA